jgi:hypothetical protein
MLGTEGGSRHFKHAHDCLKSAEDEQNQTQVPFKIEEAETMKK